MKSSDTVAHRIRKPLYNLSFRQSTIDNLLTPVLEIQDCLYASCLSYIIMVLPSIRSCTCRPNYGAIKCHC